MQVVVTGATGFMGRPLCAELVSAGHEVTVLSREPERARRLLDPIISHAAWGSGADKEWQKVVARADAVIHLAGEPLAAQRWTPEFKAKIRSSRVESTHALVEAIRRAERKPNCLVSASAVGYYGDCGDATVTEETPPGQGFLADLCVQWETEALRAREAGVRVALMRIGIVLGRGGALEKMLHPLPLPFNPWRLGLGGPIGSGRQWMAWVHIDDVVGLFSRAVSDPQLQGPYNVTAPSPVTNAAFAQAIGRVLGRPARLPVPAFALRAALGEFAETLLTGQKAIPVRAQSLGYRFRFAEVETAVTAVIRG